MDLLATPTLVVRAVSGERGHGGFVVATGEGTDVATIAIAVTGLASVVQHWASDDVKYPFTLTVADGGGDVLFIARRAREGTFGRYLQVAVHLADGREIGTVERKHPLSRRVIFREDGDAVVASAAAGRHTSGLVVQREPGRDTEWARSEFELGAPRLASRAYRLGFAADAPVLVRALLLAWTAAADVRLLAPHGGSL